MQKIIDFLHDLLSPGTDSKQWALNMKDLAKAAIVAALTPPFTVLIQSLEAGNFVIDWKSMIRMAVIAFAGYLGKNFFTRSK